LLACGRQQLVVVKFEMSHFLKLIAEFYHLPALAIIVVFGYIVLLAILRGNRVKKFDLHIESDAIPGVIRAVINLIGLRIILTLPKEVPLHIEDAVFSDIRGKKFPLTAYLLGRKITFVVEFYDYEKMGPVSLRQDLPFVYHNGATNARSSFDDIESMSLPHQIDLEHAKSLSNKSAD